MVDSITVLNRNVSITCANQILVGYEVAFTDMILQGIDTKKNQKITF